MKKNYKIRVPSTFLKKSGDPYHDKEKTQGLSTFEVLQADRQKKVDGAGLKKQKLKVRVPSKVIARAVKRAESKTPFKLKKTGRIKLKLKKKKRPVESSALSKLRRFVRARKNGGAKVHPLGSTGDVDE